MGELVCGKILTWFPKETGKKIKITTREEIFAIYVLGKGLVSRIYKELSELNKKTNNPFCLKRQKI